MDIIDPFDAPNQESDGIVDPWDKQPRNEAVSAIVDPLDLPAATTPEETPLLSGEGISSLGTVTKGTLTQAWEASQDLFNRPEAQVGKLEREDNLQIRALMDQGIPFSDAHKQVRASAEMRRAAEVDEADRIAAEKRKTRQEELQANLPENPSEPLRHAQGVASSAALALPAVAVGAATKNLPAALAIGTAPVFPLAYDESREKGSSHERALTSAGLQTTVEAAGEIVPMGGLLKDLGQDAFGKLVAKYIMREVATEVPTELVQGAIQQAIDTPERPFGEYLQEAVQTAKDTAIQTPFVAAIGGGVAGGINALLPQREESVQDPADTLNGLKATRDAAVESGDTEKAEVAQSMADTLREEFGVSADNEFMGQELNQSPSQQFVEPELLTPDREAMLTNPDPMTEEELQARMAMVVGPLKPEQTNDGTSSLGLDEALDAQIGNTQKVRANTDLYAENPNDEIPWSQRKIVFGPEGTQGQAIGNVKTQPGTYVIGEPTLDRSADVLQGYHEIFEDLRQTFMPGAKIILANESMATPQAIGTTQKLASGEYVIVPAFVRNFSGNRQSGSQDSSTFNMHTKAKAFYNIFHEFGHALTMERYLEGAAPEVQSAFMLEQKSGKVGEETIARLSAEQASLAREYNQFREQLKLQNAAWFQSEWMSPALSVQRQLIKDMKGMPDMNAESFVRRLVSRGNPEIARLNEQRKLTMDMAERQAITKQIDDLTSSLTEKYLSFDEFMAEKMARYAHEKGLGQDSTLGKGAYFKGGIEYVKKEESVRRTGLDSAMEKVQKSLRALFTALKKGLKLSNGETYRISAGTSFESWIQSLSRKNELVGERSAPITMSKAALKAVQEVRNLPNNPQGYMAKKLRKHITFGRFSVQEKQELYKLVRENSLNEAHLRIVEILKSRVVKQLDVDPENGVRFAGGDREQALKEWNQKKERSEFFKNWFGDWENDAGNASKVVAANGRPLVQFHATRADITQFTDGDVGFHFGDLIAAHARLYLSDPAAVQARIELDEYRGKRDAQGGETWRPKDTGMNIIPVYLNIRNPLEVDEIGIVEYWQNPPVFAEHLLDHGVLTPLQWETVVDLMQDMSEGTSMRERYAPLRDVLKHLGYDGLKYLNEVEGGTSWVAFEPNQIKTANATFDSGSNEIHMQVDTDLTTVTGLELDTLSKTLEKYENTGVFGRALNWVSRAQYSVLQLQQLAWIHPEFYFLELQNNASMQYNAVKSRLQAVGESIAQDWKALGKETDAMLSKALEAEANEGVHWTDLKRENGVWTHVMTANTVDKLKAVGVDINSKKGKKAAEIFLRSKNAITQHVDAAQVTLARQIGMQTLDEREFMMKLNELKKAFASIRETPFLPRGDYGQWGLVVTEQNGLERTVVYRQMFESNRDLVRARDLLEKDLKPNQKIRTVSKLPEEKRSLLALPKEYVESAAEALGMTQEEKDLMFDLLHPVKQDKLVMPYTKALEKISGGSIDRMRNFADFIWHNSTMIARTEAIAAFNKADKAAQDMYNQVDKEPGVSSKARLALLQDIRRAQMFMQSTKDYTLAPPNEWYKARSLIAITYLWGSVKTAMLNLFGITTTWSSLTSQYGDVAGNAAFAKAQKQLAELVFTDKGNPEVEALYNRAITEGFLVQNYAAHLGAAATAGVTRRLANRSRWTSEVSGGVRMVADGGMLPFTIAEQYTRRVTFLSIVNAMVTDAKARGSAVNPDSIYIEAVKQTDLLQNSYTLANRPKIMRGTVSPLLPLFTIFMSFAEHLTFHSAGGYALGVKRRAELLGTPSAKSKIGHTQRILFILLALGGYEALPFAGNILDILDAVFLKMFGKTARQGLREGIQSLPEVKAASWVNDPRWWARGMGGDVAGFDISGSLGNGNPIPGTDIAGMPPRSPEELAGKALLNTTGVTGSLTKWLLDLGITLNEGKSIEHHMTKFPGVVGYVSSAREWSERGVRGNQGELVYQPTQGEVIGKSLGFSPSELNRTREQNWARTEAVMFWTTQRQNLQAAYNQARDADDREMLADVNARIEKFNDKVMDAKLALRPWQLNKSYRAHLDTQRNRELGIVPRNVRGLAGEVDASFDVGVE